MDRHENIALFGGTFDPVHLGHMAIIKSALSENKYDKFFVVPAVISNFKNKLPSASGEDRVQMLKIAVSSCISSEFRDRVIISETELKRGGISYTSDTVKEIKENYPNSSLYLILGDDHIEKLSSWHEIDYLRENVTFVFYRRINNKVIKNAFLDKIRFTYLEMDKIYSENSTQIREDFNKYKYYTNEHVREYIYSKGLYGTK